MAALCERHQCDACLLVVTIDERTAKWAAKPFRVGPGFVLHPMVIGPSNVEVVVDIERAKAEPELAVLSAMAHGQGDAEQAAAIAFAAYHGIKNLDDERATLYWDRVIGMLSQAARQALEEMMAKKEVRFMTEFTRRNREIGKAEGEVKGKASGVLSVLDARNQAVSEDLKRRITACTDLDVLDRWLRKAAVLTRIEELFEDDLCRS